MVTKLASSRAGASERREGSNRQRKRHRGVGDPVGVRHEVHTPTEPVRAARSTRKRLRVSYEGKRCREDKETKANADICDQHPSRLNPRTPPTPPLGWRFKQPSCSVSRRRRTTPSTFLLYLRFHGRTPFQDSENLAVVGCCEEASSIPCERTAPLS